MQKHTQFQGETSILVALTGKIMSFGTQLRKWRKAKGLTQQELGDAVGYNISYISNLERDFSPTAKGGKPRPSEEACAKFAKILEVPEDEVRQAADAKTKGGIIESRGLLANTVFPNSSIDGLIYFKKKKAYHGDFVIMIDDVLYGFIFRNDK